MVEIPSNSKIRFAAPSNTQITGLNIKIKSIIGTKVSIHRGAKHKGKIEIEYYSQEELERIMDLFESIQ